MFVFILITLIQISEPEVINCKDLAIGQFVCQTPNVSNDTQVLILPSNTLRYQNATFFHYVTRFYYVTYYVRKYFCCRNMKAVVKNGEFV